MYPKFALTKPYLTHLIGLTLLAMIFFATPRAMAQESKSSSNWNVGFSWNKGVKGNGQVTQDVRAVGAFSEIRSKGAVDLVIRPASKEAVTVVADSNLQPIITTAVEGNALVIDSKGSWSSKAKIQVIVDVVNVSVVSLSGSGDLTAAGLVAKAFSVSISGSGNARLENFQAESLNVSISGSGDFYAAGKAPAQSYRIAGSGDIRTDALEGANVSVNIAGSGDAKVWATQGLEASIAGSGDVRYKGTPTNVKKRVAGSGSVSQM
jgi:hypothetical protein